MITLVFSAALTELTLFALLPGPVHVEQRRCWRLNIPDAPAIQVSVPREPLRCFSTPLSAPWNLSHL